MSIAFCIGNGESRRNYDLTYLRRYGKLYGSNAIYRDTNVDYLICGDRRMVDEALHNNYTGMIYTKKDCVMFFKTPQVKVLPDFDWQQDIKWKQYYHWGSGLHAVHLALKSKCNRLFMIGHDVTGNDSNLYAGTQNYHAKDFTVDPIFWVKQFGMLIDMYPNVEFCFIQDLDKWALTKTWTGLNTATISFTEAERIIKKEQEWQQ